MLGMPNNIEYAKNVFGDLYKRLGSLSTLGEGKQSHLWHGVNRAIHELARSGRDTAVFAGQPLVSRYIVDADSLFTVYDMQHDSAHNRLKGPMRQPLLWGIERENLPRTDVLALNPHKEMAHYRGSLAVPRGDIDLIKRDDRLQQISSFIGEYFIGCPQIIPIPIIEDIT
jgi:hypothetical protein